MHICFLEDTKLEGGTQIWVVEAAQWLMNNGCDVTIVSPEGGFTALEAEKLSGVRLVTYDYEGVESKSDESIGLWKDAFTPCDVIVMTCHPPRFKGQLNKYDDGFFHVSQLAAKAISAGGLNCTLLAKTGSIVKEYKKEFYYQPEIKSKVVAITRFTFNYLRDVYQIPEDALCFCYQGTDVKRFFSEALRMEEAKKRYPTPADAFPIFGCVGAFEKRKGQEFLMDAMVKVVAKHPNAFLTIVGQNGRDGDIEGALKDAVKTAGIEKNVDFHPFTKEPMYVYEAIDVVVVSSLMEGLPNVLLEGAAMKKALVSTNIAGCPECVIDGKTGFLCEPGSVESLSDSMMKICEAGPEGVKELGEAGCQHVTDTMDKNTQFPEFKKLYETLMQS